MGVTPSRGWSARSDGIRFAIAFACLCVISGRVEWANAQPVSKVMVTEVQQKELPATTRVVGTVNPNRMSIVGSEISGLVSALPAREGDFIEKGSVICQLNDDIARLELEAAQRSLEALSSSVEVAKAELDRWAFEKQRVERLRQENLANEKEISDTHASYLVALNTLHEVQQRKEEQEVLVQLRRRNLEKTQIRAPFDGYITELYSEVGQWMQSGGSVVEMIDLESVLVRVDVPESAIRHVGVGDDVAVQVDALGKRFAGRVRHIIPLADERARTFPVEIQIANPEHELRGGMFARATVRSGPDVVSPAVPKDAVVYKDGVNRIWMIQSQGPQGSMAIPISVTLGSEIGDWVAITSGNVPPETQVVIRGNERLMPFPAPVQVVNEEALLTENTASDAADIHATTPTPAESDHQG